MEVRWDAVAQGNRFWSEPGPRAHEAERAGEAIAVEVWLFGGLADAAVPRPLELTLQNPLRVGDVIAELERVGGDELRRKLAGTDGGKLPACRVFVDGAQLEDPQAPLEVRRPRARIEMILLTGIEGG